MTKIFLMVSVYTGLPLETKTLGMGTSLQAPFANALKQDFPEAEQAGRINSGELFGAGSNQIRRSDKNVNSYKEGFAWADQSLLEVLSLPVVYGYQANTLEEPNTMVISNV
jgi:putative ABC transport system permease protein